MNLTNDYAVMLIYNSSTNKLNKKTEQKDKLTDLNLEIAFYLFAFSFLRNYCSGSGSRKKFQIYSMQIWIRNTVQSGLGIRSLVSWANHSFFAKKWANTERMSNSLKKTGDLLIRSILVSNLNNSLTSLILVGDLSNSLNKKGNDWIAHFFVKTYRKLLTKMYQKI